MVPIAAMIFFWTIVSDGERFWALSVILPNFDRTASVKFSNNVSLLLECSRPDLVTDRKDYEVWIMREQSLSCTVREAEGRSEFSDGSVLVGRLDSQSSLTPLLVDNIFLGHCALPTLGESVSQHCVFISAMVEHWRLCSGNSLSDRAPIT